ncbi:hypothetical protein N9849_00735, partial [bacterium]|nr:hypothetical protein [bacterium]
LNASAVGIYGDQGGRKIAEDAPVGNNYLAELCLAWEKAAEDAPKVTFLRTGVVLGKGELGRKCPRFSSSGSGGSSVPVNSGCRGFTSPMKSKLSSSVSKKRSRDQLISLHSRVSRMPSSQKSPEQSSGARPFLPPPPLLSNSHSATSLKKASSQASESSHRS